MAALIWLLIPLLAGVIATVWASWAIRQHSKSGSGDVAGVAGYDAFRSVMERSAMEKSRNPGDATMAHISSDGPSRTAD
ncbi:hypothetical protein [Streptomyces gobiensis]|uniref:hypothetical protein n=1 Tax=Streptomyces gobiensis TaxID=2875706 RepID=UPI001E49FDE9|nr:hypothetical protein [Streptomyces gobiensis]UGY93524.1 hypothetical protein test1122_18555 [Streptomyces gobiensis]